MNVMYPDLLWIGDRCYRLPVLDSSSGGTYQTPEDESVNWETQLDYTEGNFMDEEEDAYGIDEVIETLPNNRFKLNLSIPQTFWSKIIGSKGVTKKRIESDTNTSIVIPRPTEQGDVVIRGTSKRNIILAKKSIDAVIFSSRQKLIFTHFISIPMHLEEIKKNFLIFKDQVIKVCGKDRGVEDSIFQKPEKLHLTIGALVLTDQSERKLAEKSLNEVFEKSIKPLVENGRNVNIEMRGIEYMNDDPSEVDVLYGKITLNENDVIQKIADLILNHFSTQKLLKFDEKEEVKLHVTLMNTLFREEGPDELNIEAEGLNRNKWNKKTRRTFNAVNILKNFHDFYFGLQELKSIQLSVRFSTGKDGYYKSSCVVNI